jgi:hypothetical protein
MVRALGMGLRLKVTTIADQPTAGVARGKYAAWDNPLERTLNLTVAYV